MSQNSYFLLNYGTKERFELSPEKDKFYIGRSPECDIICSSIFVSRIQCEISRIPNEDSLQLKNISKTNSTYIDNIQLSVSNSVAQVKVGSIIGLGVPLEYVNTINSEFIFLEVCKDSNFQKTVEPQNHFSITVIKKGGKKLPFKQNVNPNITLGLIQVSKEKNGKSIYDSPEPTKKFMQEGSFLIDRHNKPSTSQQVVPLNIPKYKPNFGAQEIHDVVNIDDDNDDDVIINSSTTKNQFSSRILKNNIIEKEAHEIHEIKNCTQIKAEPEQLTKKEICAKLKNEHKHLVGEERNVIEVNPMSNAIVTNLSCLKNALIPTSHTQHNLRSNTIQESDTANSNNEHLPCDKLELNKGCSSINRSVKTPEQVSHHSSCSINNMKLNEENTIKTSYLAAMDAESQSLNQEYEYEYIDSEDASILEQIIVDETISKDKFSNYVEDVKPNFDILQANLKNSSASTFTNCEDENKLTCEPVVPIEYDKQNPHLMPEHLRSNSLTSLPHNNIMNTKNSHSVTAAANSHNVKIKNRKPYKPMVFLPAVNLNNKNTFPDESFGLLELNTLNTDKCSYSDFSDAANDSPKQFEAESLKRTLENNDDFNINIANYHCKKMRTDPVFERSDFKTKNDSSVKQMNVLKDCKVLISPLIMKKNLAGQPDQLSILDFNAVATSVVGNKPVLISQCSDSTKLIKINQHMDEYELHTECARLKPVRINKSVTKVNVTYSSDSDTSDIEIKGKNPPKCRKEELSNKSNSNVACSTMGLSKKNNQNYDRPNPEHFIPKSSIDSSINEKENIFPNSSYVESKQNIILEKIKNIFNDSATSKNELKSNLNSRASVSEGRENTLKENDYFSHLNKNDSKILNATLNDEISSFDNKESIPLRLNELKSDNAENMNEAKLDIKCENLLSNVPTLNKELVSSSEAATSYVKVKKEPTENDVRMVVDDSSDLEDDDIDVINYSQMDDIIYISSDDECDSSQDHILNSSKDVSFGPLPPSPERELCMEEIEHEFESMEADLCGKDRPLSNFLSKETDKSCVVDGSFKINELENDKFASSSKEGLNIKLDSNKEESVWWPILSQEFDSDENVNSHETDLDDIIDTDVLHNTTANHKQDKNELDYVIEKIKKTKLGTTKLTEPKLPFVTKKISVATKARKHKSLIADPQLPNTSRKCKEVNKTNCFDDGNKISSKLDDSGSMDKPNCSILSKNKLQASWKTKRKKNSSDIGSLRKKIMKTHNLDPYKKIANTKSKERHHLLSSSKESDGKLNQSSSSVIMDKDPSGKEQNLKANSVISTSKYCENISVKPKSSGNKGIAKSCTVSRSQKLTEVNLFKSPTKSKSKSKFKIPKKSSKLVETVLNNKENTANLPTKPFPVTSVIGKRVLTPVESSGASDKNSNKKFSHDLSLQKGILKSPSKYQLRGPKNRVTFPRYDDDLCKVTIISPRKKSDRNNFSAPDNVKLKEVLKGNLKPISMSVSNRVENPQEFIYNICNWNYDWLSTYQKAKNNPSRTKVPNPPKVCESAMLPTLTVYNSYEDYKEVFSNLMYYETWENVYKDWEQHLSNNTWFQSLVDSIQRGFLKTKLAPLKYCTVTFFIPISRELSMHGKHPNNGSLIAMKHKHNNKTNFAFGYVQNIVKKTNLKYMPQELKAICMNNEDTVLQLSITFSKLYLETSLKPGMLVLISNISYIKPSLRAYEALCQLRKSLLCPALLNPGIICSMRTDENCNTTYIIPEITLNDVQKNAVIKVSEECIVNLNQPKISLIHGPPGTGKTLTIIALISQINLLYKEKKLRSRRILLCAPSNAAVDELTYKLMKLREVNLNLNIVRFGVEQSFSQQVNECSFDTKVRKEFERRISQCQNISVQQELQLKKQYALSATEDYEKALKEKISKAEIKRLEIRMIELLRSEKDLQDRSKIYLNSDEKVKLNNDCKKMILMQAEIIACTLNSCLSGAVFEIFSSQPSSFACCIVDEAGQCKETETWMPLQLGINRLILVGDHLQLPATVLSNVAQGKKLHQSLFERVYHHVGFELQDKSVIHSLTMQYRMHEDICAWPSSHFYYSMLRTAPGVSQDRKCFLKPFILLDLEDSIEVNEFVGEICNKIEVQAIVSILDCIASQLTHFSVGILTPYQKQRILLSEKIKPYSKDIKIKVSTIDNFQGQEKDVIICSFVRANVGSRLGFVSDRQRLNVALTRAKRALIVIGHMQSLKSNEDWKSLIEDCQRRNLVHRANLKLLSQKKELYKLLEAKR